MLKMASEAVEAVDPVDAVEAVETVGAAVLGVAIVIVPGTKVTPVDTIRSFSFCLMAFIIESEPFANSSLLNTQ